MDERTPMQRALDRDTQIEELAQVGETEHGDRVFCPAMSLRAYIATAAMQGLIAGGIKITAEDTANDAVNYADALLAALARKE